MAIFTLVMICEKDSLQLYTSVSRKVESHRLNVITETFLQSCKVSYTSGARLPKAETKF